MEDFATIKNELEAQLIDINQKITESKDAIIESANKLRQLKADYKVQMHKLYASKNDDAIKEATKQHKKQSEILHETLRNDKRLLRKYARMHSECEKQLLDVEASENQLILLQQALETQPDQDMDPDAVLKVLLDKNKLALRDLIAKLYWEKKLSMPEDGDIEFDMSDTSISLSVHASYSLDPEIAKLATSLGIRMDDVEALINRQLHIKELFESTLHEIIDTDMLDQRKSEIMDLAVECHYKNDFIEEQILNAKKMFLKDCIHKFVKGKSKQDAKYLYQKGAELSISCDDIDNMIQRLQTVMNAQKGENDIKKQIKQANKKPFIITWLSTIPCAILEIIFTGGWSVLCIPITAGIAWCVTKIISMKNEITIRKIDGGIITYFKTHTKNKGQNEINQMQEETEKYINETIGLEHTK